MSKKIIYGDTVGTPAGRPDWAEENERSAAYIRNKPLAIVDEYDSMLELDDKVTLCCVTQNRKRHVPITLEVGIHMLASLSTVCPLHTRYFAKHITNFLILRIIFLCLVFFFAKDDFGDFF